MQPTSLPWSLTVLRGGASIAQDEEETKTSKKKKKKRSKTTTNPSSSNSPVTSTTKSSSSSSSSTTSITTDPFPSIAQFLIQRLHNKASSSSLSSPQKSQKESLVAFVQALRTLSLAQQAFKGLDGVAHEAYQRSSNTKKRNVVTTSVRGRAQRSAQRTCATATALEACELCELLEATITNTPHQQQQAQAKQDEEMVTITDDDDDRITAWAQERGYQVLYLNTTSPELQIPTISDSSTSVTRLSVLVLYDPFYRGGAGAHHASIEDLYAATPTNETLSPSPRGKLIIVLGNRNDHLDHLLQVLDQPPLPISTTPIPTSGAPPPSTGKIPSKVETAAKPTTVSVQPRLYDVAGKLLQLLRPILEQQRQPFPNDDSQQQSNQTNTTAAMKQPGQSQATAIHLVGRSLAGGVACLAAAMLDGTLPMPPLKSTGKSGGDSTKKTSETEPNNINNTATTLEAWARGRCSATVLGCPPCLSPNLPVPFVTSILLGDDIACRTTHASLERMTARVARHTTGQDSWWHKVAQPTAALTDALSMTVSSLKTAATSSSAANDPARLAVSGQAYLIRPRRLGAAGGSSSIHEVALGGGKREALRAAVLWQLDDIMLSNSLWKHHLLESYIHGLDRVQLRGVDDSDETNDDEAK